jgi:tRNA modification GTPase
MAQGMMAGQRQQANCTVLCVDARGSDLANEIADFTTGGRSKHMLLVVTKIDLLPGKLDLHEQPRMIACSSRTGAGLAKLATAIAALLGQANMAGAVASTAARCVDSLERAKESVESALTLVTAGGGDELIAAEIRSCLQELGRVVGVVYTDDVLDRVFSQFCIGK